MICTLKTIALSRTTTTVIKSTAMKCGLRYFSVSSAANMRFVQFNPKSGGPQHLGAQIAQDGDIFDISAVDSSVPNSLVKFLAAGNGVLEKAKRSVTLLFTQ